MSDKIIQAISQMAGTHGRDNTHMVVCSVTSVDESTRTCAATTIGNTASTDIINIQLMAEVDDGMLLIPTVGSTIIVGYSDRNVPYVALFSQIDKVDCVVGDTAISTTDGNVTISQDEMTIELSGGKIKISNNGKSLYAIMQNILNHVLALTVPTGAGNSGTALNFQSFNDDLNDLSQLMQ